MQEKEPYMGVRGIDRKIRPRDQSLASRSKRVQNVTVEAMEVLVESTEQQTTSISGYTYLTWNPHTQLLQYLDYCFSLRN